jgi:hypothetical protein
MVTTEPFVSKVQLFLIYNTLYLFCILGDPGAIRTRDLQIRNLLLYPAELRDHWGRLYGMTGRD